MKLAVEDRLALQDLIANMWETMYASSGVGLAAPQINRSIRLFVVDSLQIIENLEEEEKKDNVEIVEEVAEPEKEKDTSPAEVEKELGDQEVDADFSKQQDANGEGNSEKKRNFNWYLDAEEADIANV